MALDLGPAVGLAWTSRRLHRWLYLVHLRRHTCLVKAGSGRCPYPTSCPPGSTARTCGCSSSDNSQCEGFAPHWLLPLAAVYIPCGCAILDRAPLDADREVVPLELIPGANVSDGAFIGMVILKSCLSCVSQLHGGAAATGAAARIVPAFGGPHWRPEAVQYQYGGPTVRPPDHPPPPPPPPPPRVCVPITTTTTTTAATTSVQTRTQSRSSALKWRCSSVQWSRSTKACRRSRSQCTQVN